jgi:hypothetical protein
MNGEDMDLGVLETENFIKETTLIPPDRGDLSSEVTVSEVTTDLIPRVPIKGDCRHIWPICNTSRKSYEIIKTSLRLEKIGMSLDLYKNKTFC